MTRTSQGETVVVHPSVLMIIVVLHLLLFAACIDGWRFKAHYVVTLPWLISVIVFQGMQDEIGALQVSLTIGLSGMAILLVFFVLATGGSHAAAEAPAELQKFNN